MGVRPGETLQETNYPMRFPSCRVDIDAKEEPGLFHLLTMFQLLSKHELISIFTYGTVCLYCFHYFDVYNISKNSSKVSCSPKHFRDNIHIF